VTNEQLTAILAERILGWSVAPERFLLGNRQWITRLRFQPLNRIQDAFRLLQATAGCFSVTKTASGAFTATIQIGHRTGTASGPAAAATITRAIARAIGVDLEGGQ
jgi:hypothetical protein